MVRATDKQWAALALMSLTLVSCERAAEVVRAVGERVAGGESQPAAEPAAPPSPGEHITASEVTEARQLEEAVDPVAQEIETYRLATRQDYNNRRFDALEKNAAEVREERATFGNGSWKTAQFYDALACRDSEPEAMWELHDRIHREWIDAKPESVTAMVAYAEFLTDYAWRARGGGYANTVTDDGFRLFGQRLDRSFEILRQAALLGEKDPHWGLTAMTVALGQGWPKTEYDLLVAQAVAQEPKFWGYDTTRAYSLLPRWYGEPGDWEAYAEKAAARPNGLGNEVYARIVINLSGFYDDIFRESRADWAKTRAGLDAMLARYPQSLSLQNEAARLATIARDREYAAAAFARLGDRYVKDVWRKPDRFVHYRTWARTGEW